CGRCAREAYNVTNDMQPLCPSCRGVMQLVAVTGHTVEEAITRAAQEVPDQVEASQPRQQVLPGTRPIFDAVAALDSIEQHELAASLAEREYQAAAAKAKEKRKAADDQNAKLRDLIREFKARRHDARYDEPPADVVDSSAPSEDPSLGPAVSPASGKVDSAAVAVDNLPTDDDMPPATLQLLLAKAGADITVVDVAAWTLEQQAEARTW